MMHGMNRNQTIFLYAIVLFGDVFSTGLDRLFLIPLSKSGIKLISPNMLLSPLFRPTFRTFLFNGTIFKGISHLRARLEGISHMRANKKEFLILQ